MVVYYIRLLYYNRIHWLLVRNNIFFLQIVNFLFRLKTKKKTFEVNHAEKHLLHNLVSRPLGYWKGLSEIFTLNLNQSELLFFGIIKVYSSFCRVSLFLASQ